MSASMTYSSRSPTQISMEKRSLNAIPLGFFLVQILLLPIIINLDLVGRIWRYFSRSHSYIQTQISLLDNPKFESSKKRHDNLELSNTNTNTNKQHKLKEAQEDRSANLYREEVEVVMERLEIFCHPQGGKLKKRIGYGYMSKVFEQEEPRLDEVREAFNVFDQNGDGFIDANELQRVLCNLGLKEGLEIENCRKMINLIDENEDERIDFNEFVKLMESCFC